MDSWILGLADANSKRNVLRLLCLQAVLPSQNATSPSARDRTREGLKQSQVEDLNEPITYVSATV